MAIADFCSWDWRRKWTRHRQHGRYPGTDLRPPWAEPPCVQCLSIDHSWWPPLPTIRASDGPCGAWATTGCAHSAEPGLDGPAPAPDGDGSRLCTTARRLSPDRQRRECNSARSDETKSEAPTNWQPIPPRSERPPAKMLGIGIEPLESRHVKQFKKKGDAVVAENVGIAAQGLWRRGAKTSRHSV